MMISSWR